MRDRLLQHGPTAIVAVGVIALSSAYGGYPLTARGVAGVAVWWAVILGLGLGLLPLKRPTRAAYLSGGLLAALAVLAGISMLWSASPGASFLEFNRVTLYLGFFVLAVLASTTTNLVRYSDGLAFGIAVIGLVALVSRLFPDLFPSSLGASGLPNAEARLSFPIGYWNALGMLIAMALPLLLRTSASSRSAFGQVIPIAAIPALVAAIFMTSSRGALLAAGLGVAAVVALSRPRGVPLWATACSVAGALLMLLVLTRHEILLEDPAQWGDRAGAAAWTFSVIALPICLLAGTAYFAGRRLAGRHGATLPHLSSSPSARALVATTLLLVVAGIAIAADPTTLVQDFVNPGFERVQQEGVERLTTPAGSGRYQFWTAALEQFAANPVSGSGAGTYEFWWAEHPRLPYTLRDAHSLYMELLGELGIAGLLLLLGAGGVGLVAGIRRLSNRPDTERLTVAALCAVLLVWLFAAGIDWMWEVPVVTGVAIVSLALLTGPGTLRRSQPQRSHVSTRVRANRNLGVGVAIIALAWIIICAQAAPLLSQLRLQDSRAAVVRGDLWEARHAAEGAALLQPWAASPHRQIALVDEERGRLYLAREEIYRAIGLESQNYILWGIAARIEARLGNTSAARTNAERARRLNPRQLAGQSQAG